jgi:hypothetical protein
MNPLTVWLLCAFSFFLGFLIAGMICLQRAQPLPPSDVEQKDTLDDTADTEITAEWETIFCDRR